MAGNWIKIEHSTPDKPEVYQLAEILEIDPNAALGALVRFWMWVDDQCESCNALTVTNVTLDRITTVTGFSAALQKVGWLTRDGATITVPNLERHNGQTAKNRATTSKRVAKHRAGCNGQSVTNVTVRALPEKRREEKSNNTPPPPQGVVVSQPELIPTETTSGFMPPNWKRLSSKSQKIAKVKFNTPQMIQIGSWFHRRESNLWTVSEAASLIAIEPSEAEVDGMGRYYLAEIDPDKDIRRHDMPTLLGNWAGELDRARAFCRKEGA